MGSSPRGVALVDLVFTCGLVALLAAIALPAMRATRERDAVRLAARYMANQLRLARIEALKRNVTVAMRIDLAGGDRLATFADGDGDGVQQRDIDRGTDVPLGSETRLSDYFATVSFRIANDVPAPDGQGTLVANSDPVRLGASDLASFSPLGSTTSGTIYLAGQSGSQMAVRLLGATGRMRVLWFDAASGAWRED